MTTWSQVNSLMIKVVNFIQLKLTTLIYDFS